MGYESIAHEAEGYKWQYMGMHGCTLQYIYIVIFGNVLLNM